MQTNITREGERGKECAILAKPNQTVLLPLLLPVLKCTNFHCTRLISINSRLCVCVDSVPQFSKALIELSFFWTANLSVELLLLLPLVATSPSAVCVCCLSPSSFSG